MIQHVCYGKNRVCRGDKRVTQGSKGSDSPISICGQQLLQQIDELCPCVFSTNMSLPSQSLVIYVWATSSEELKTCFASFDLLPIPASWSTGVLSLHRGYGESVSLHLINTKLANPVFVKYSKAGHALKLPDTAASPGVAGERHSPGTTLSVASQNGKPGMTLVALFLSGWQVGGTHSPGRN